MSSEHTLFVVATPIGHRDDLSIRAIGLLRQVKRIYAEDTRHSLPLLRYHGIETPVFALHEHNEDRQSEQVVDFLCRSGDAALISDAGTPLISDPGYRLVRQCHKAGVRVSPVPGPSALTAALSVGGLPTDRFEFLGFPPTRRAARIDWIHALLDCRHTVVIYEAPHRILVCLEDMVDCLGPDRPLTLARELSKRFETVLPGTAGTILDALRHDPDQQKGEFVLLLGANEKSKKDPPDADLLPALDRTLQVLLPHMPLKLVAKCAAELQGIPRKRAYDRALKLQGR